MDALGQLFMARRSPLTKMLIVQQFGVSVKGVVDVANTLVKEA
jgi:hypothetical protein